nr:cadherin-like domain-containing protein [Oscillospiraceae bacterium]MBQ8245471.1 cadherin-like domain-containing protein [Oscillospiraceae bacterium]
MRSIRKLSLLLALCCAVLCVSTAFAAEVDCDATYCFTPTDFSENENLKGICVTGLPTANTGTVMLGSRVIRTGDILAADQLEQLTFSPLRTETDQEAVVTYLPIYENRVESATTMTLSIKGKKDEAPVAQDSTMETYKNLSNQGKLAVSDPEKQSMTYTVLRQPKRGSVTVNEDGTFTYTPKKNKVGVDSFTYTATDPAGNVSREATVTVQILKPTDATQYTDTVGKDCRFEAEWLRNTGLFVGESVAGESCFFPEKAVSRGEFVSTLVQALGIPTDAASYTAVPADTPDWLKPYLAAAMRSGLTADLPMRESGSFEADQPITGAEAAVMIQNALDLSVSQTALEAVSAEGADEAVPSWAAASVTVMSENGVVLTADQALTRGELAKALYRVSYLSVDAPGMQVIRKQK